MCRQVHATYGTKVPVLAERRKKKQKANKKKKGGKKKSLNWGCLRQKRSIFECVHLASLSFTHLQLPVWQNSVQYSNTSKSKLRKWQVVCSFWRGKLCMVHHHLFLFYLHNIHFMYLHTILSRTCNALWMDSDCTINRTVKKSTTVFQANVHQHPTKLLHLLSFCMNAQWRQKRDEPCQQAKHLQ